MSLFWLVSIIVFFVHSIRCDSSRNAYLQFGPLQEKILNDHNKYRKQHHVPRLNWKYRLAGQADARAAALDRMDNVYPTRLSGDGENLWFKAGITVDDILTNETANPVDSWYSEIEFYPNEPSEKWSQFTQLIWKDTKHLGCVHHYSFGLKGVVVVCYYSPIGNEPDKFLENVFTVDGTPWFKKNDSFKDGSKGESGRRNGSLTVDDAGSWADGGNKISFDSKDRDESSGSKDLEGSGGRNSSLTVDDTRSSADGGNKTSSDSKDRNESSGSKDLEGSGGRNGSLTVDVAGPSADGDNKTSSDSKDRDESSGSKDLEGSGGRNGSLTVDVAGPSADGDNKTSSDSKDRDESSGSKDLEGSGGRNGSLTVDDTRSSADGGNKTSSDSKDRDESSGSKDLEGSGGKNDSLTVDVSGPSADGDNKTSFDGKDYEESSGSKDYEGSSGSKDRKESSTPYWMYGLGFVILLVYF